MATGIAGPDEGSEARGAGAAGTEMTHMVLKAFPRIPAVTCVWHYLARHHTIFGIASVLYTQHPCAKASRLKDT